MNLPDNKNVFACGLNDTQLESVEEMAYHGFSPSEIIEVMELITAGALEAFNNKNSRIHKAYRKGFLKSQLELRQRIFLDAKHGSSPAQAMAVKILENAEYKLNSE